MCTLYTKNLLPGGEMSLLSTVLKAFRLGDGILDGLSRFDFSKISARGFGLGIFE